MQRGFAEKRVPTTRRSRYPNHWCRRRSGSLGSPTCGTSRSGGVQSSAVPSGMFCCARLARTSPAAKRIQIVAFPERRLGAAITRMPTSSRGSRSCPVTSTTGAASPTRRRSSDKLKRSTHAASSPATGSGRTERALSRSSRRFLSLDDGNRLPVLDQGERRHTRSSYINNNRNTVNNNFGMHDGNTADAYRTNGNPFTIITRQMARKR
jgi:hypothetical protein